MTGNKINVLSATTLIYVANSVDVSSLYKIRKSILRYKPQLNVPIFKPSDRIKGADLYPTNNPYGTAEEGKTWDFFIVTQ